MGLLDSSAVGVGDNDFQIGLAPRLTAAFAKKRDGFYPLAPGGSEGPENIWRIPARRKTDQQVIRVGQSLDLSGKNLVEAVVIADAGEQCAIGHQADRRE